MNPAFAKPENVPHKMKRLTSLVILGVIALQIGVFWASWLACVVLARAMGRFPSTWFGEWIFFFGLVWFAVVCTCVSIFTAKVRHRLARWIAIIGGMAFLSYRLLSEDWDRPIAMPVFLAVGCVVLLAANGLLIPYLRKMRETRRG